MKKSSQKTFLKHFVIVAVEFVLTPLNLAQITALDSGSTRANCFCSQTNKNCNLLLPNIAICFGYGYNFNSKLQIFSAPVKMQKKSLCVVQTRHNLRNFLPRSSIKKFLVLFSKRTLIFSKLTNRQIKI